MIEQAFQITIYETLFLSGLIFAASLLLGNRVKLFWLTSIVIIAFTGKLILFLGAGGMFGNWVGGHYNWEGKIFSTVYTLFLIIVFFGKNLEQVGFTLAQTGPLPRLGIGIAIFTVIATVAWNTIYFPGIKSEPTIDILYQATMPSLDEELWFRGLLLAMLFKGFSINDVIRKNYYPIFLATTIVTIQFWAVHSITSDGDWSFIFRPWYNPVAGIYGALYIVVRLCTGSLILPILLHTFANITGYFI